MDFQMVTVAAPWIVDLHNFSYIRSRGHPVATVCFVSSRPTIWEKSKIGIQVIIINNKLALLHFEC